MTYPADSTPIYDRAKWPPGPWQDEADYVSWTTATGLNAQIIRHQGGHLCGYVEVSCPYPPIDCDRVMVHSGRQTWRILPSGRDAVTPRRAAPRRTE